VVEVHPEVTFTQLVDEPLASKLLDGIEAAIRR
jgi:hypothetical protein